MKAIGESLPAVAFFALLGLCAYLYARPAAVLVGLDCQGEQVRIYGPQDGDAAVKACRTVQRHNVGR